MDLPLELFQDVARRLSRKDLKELRLVCKQFAENLVPLVFDSVFLSMHPSDLDKTNEALVNFRPFIKTLILCPLKYGGITRQAYHDRVRGFMPIKRLPYRSRFQEHIKMSYRCYCRVQKRASAREVRSKMQRLVRTLLETAPSLNRVVLTHRHRHIDFTDLELACYCRWKTCSISRDMHLMFRITPFLSQATRLSDISDILSSVISGSGPKVKELVMEPSNTARRLFCLGVADLDTLVDDQPQLPNFMANLTKLRLDMSRLNDQADAFSTGTVARQLALAHNLEHLFFQIRPSSHLFDYPGTSAFRLSLGNCRYPKLRTLILVNFQMEGDEVLPFILHSTGLRHFVLHGCTLSGYLWKQVLEMIKAHMCLQALHMDSIRGGIEYPFNRHVYSDYDGEIHKFLSHNGPNPFDVESLRINASKPLPTASERLAPPGGRHVDAYYDEYFK